MESCERLNAAQPQRYKRCMEMSPHSTVKPSNTAEAISGEM
jgi:hypothetical protein